MLQEGFLFFLYLYRMKVSFDFEQPLVDMEEPLDKLRQVADKSKVNVAASITELEQKLPKARNDIYSNLRGWHKVQLSRHPERPYTLDYISMLCDYFIALLGDRTGREHV